MGIIVFGITDRLIVIGFVLGISVRLVIFGFLISSYANDRHLSRGYFIANDPPSFVGGTAWPSTLGNDWYLELVFVAGSVANLIRQFTKIQLLLEVSRQTCDNFAIATMHVRHLKLLMRLIVGSEKTNRHQQCGRYKSQNSFSRRFDQTEQTREGKESQRRQFVGSRKRSKQTANKITPPVHLRSLVQPNAITICGLLICVPGFQSPDLREKIKRNDNTGRSGQVIVKRIGKR